MSVEWTDVNLAWVAGIVEGEGHIRGKPATGTRADGRTFNSVTLQVNVSMTDEDVVLRLHEWTGVGSFSGPRQPASALKRFPNAKPLWDFRVCGQEAHELIVAILPWLGDRRQQQATEALEAWQSAPGHWSKTAERHRVSQQARDALHKARCQRWQINADKPCNCGMHNIV